MMENALYFVCTESSAACKLQPVMKCFSSIVFYIIIYITIADFLEISLYSVGEKKRGDTQHKKSVVKSTYFLQGTFVCL